MNKSGKKPRKVYVYTKDLELQEIYPTTADCARALGISQGNIVLACQGVLKTYKDMYFSYQPLLTNEDVEALHMQGEAKRNKRDNQVTQAQTKYREKNKDKLREIALRYYYNHREEMLTYQKERYHRLKNERIQDSSGTTS
jgi:hypothetical protein